MAKGRAKAARLAFGRAGVALSIPGQDPQMASWGSLETKGNPSQLANAIWSSGFSVASHQEMAFVTHCLGQRGSARA